MRGFILSLLLVIYALNSFAQTQVAKKTSGGMGYLEYLPADYASSSSLYPCIIFLHGSGEKGDGSRAELAKVANNGTPKFIKNGATMCFTVNGKNECFIVLSPQLAANQGSWSGFSLAFAQWALANYRIDPDRLYLTGLSLGGNGTWIEAWNPSTSSTSLYAAIAPVSGWGSLTDGCEVATRQIPVWAFHGDNDQTVKIATEETPIVAMTTCNPNPGPIFTVIAGGTHGSNVWDPAYSPTHTYYNPNVYEWFLTQKRGVKLPAIPICGAGPDKTVKYPTNLVTLKGNTSDPDGTIVSTTWTQVSGPSTPFVTAPTNVQTNLYNLVLGTYVFKLTAIDNSGSSNSDLVKIVVTAGTNTPPLANAGTDKVLTLPTNSISVTGTGTDADGTVASHTWTKFSGPAAALVNTTTPTLTASNLVAGSYVFRLTVKDDLNASFFDDVTITVNDAGGNVAPVANAGVDKAITLPTSSVVLTGSATDSDGTISTYAWSKTSGGAVTLMNAATTSLTASGLVVGTYVFRLTATDNGGLTHYNEATVVVSPAPNVAPLANAGVDKAITLPTSSVVLAGNATDSDGTISTYAWTQISGGASTLTNATTASLTTSGLVVGIYVFRLTVTDNSGTTNFDEATVVVNPASTGNALPIANAGPDGFVAYPETSIIISGSGTDRDGTITTYLWKKTQGGPVTLTNTDTPTLTASSLATGVYLFSLTVTDNLGATNLDYVQVVVNSANDIAPVSNAGLDVVLTLPTNSVTLAGSGTDSDGTIISYAWRKYQGGAVSMTNISTPSVTLSGLAAGSYLFGLTVTDNFHATSVDYITVEVKQAAAQTSSARSGSNQTETVSNEEESSVEESSSKVAILGQNYPNPFTSSTTIPFSIKTDQHVVVKVFDFYGAEIQTLVNEELKAGEHTVVFTPAFTNQFYLIRLVADGKVHAIKAIQL